MTCVRSMLEDRKDWVKGRSSRRIAKCFPTSSRMDPPYATWSAKVAARVATGQALAQASTEVLECCFAP